MLKLDGAGPGPITCVLLGRLGDTVVATPFLRAVRARYPKRELRLVLSASCKGLAPLFDFSPAGIVWVDRWHKGGGLAAAAALRRGSAVVIDLNPAPSKSAAALMLLAKAPAKVGFRKDRLNAPFTAQLDKPREDEPMLDRYARLAAFFDAGFLYTPMPRLAVPEGARTEAAQWAGPRRALGQTVIGIHPGNFKKHDNRWPEEKFVALIDRLQEDRSLKLVLLCGPGERTRVEAIAKACRFPIDVQPPASLERTAALLQQLDLFVCNITGTTHLAHAVGARTFGLYAGYTDAVWRPRDPRCGGVASKDWTSCRSITVDDAYAGLNRVLSTPKDPSAAGTSGPV